ncbi:MAG: sigma-54 dependent transcriptional regulator [Bdellovibrionales bacterium]|jgi:DNA-binding NtrC family response regulator|nr:sigma-54 dependent transcriptional regulator [Bdellovibrionales bacterium]
MNSISGIVGSNPRLSQAGGKPVRALVVDDESSLRTALFRILDRQGFQVVTANNKREAEALLATDTPFDLALIDLRLPDGDGLDLMTKIRQGPSVASSQTTTALANPHAACQVIILTGHGSIENAVKATQMGAFHFITKPFNMEELISIVDKAISHKTLQTENQHLRSALSRRYRFENIIGNSDEIRHVLSMVERVADSDSTVLVTGESGTGKELIAKAIHYNSSRSNRPFVPVNCGAIPAELLESELFGHVKGAFTGAIANRQGRFDLANGGTLFLDEIGELPLNLQVKLLRVLQERRFEPVGGMKTHEADVRVIAATNVDLAKAVQKGVFREDLFYRLNVIPVRLPSLKERKGDVPLLLHHFMQISNDRAAERAGQTRIPRQLAGFSPDAMTSLAHYPWPGNIRELENLVERLAVLKGEGTIEVQDLPEQYQVAARGIIKPGGYDGLSMDAVDLPESGLDFNSAVDAYENALILQALEKTGWNRNQAAALLKLNRTTLVEKIKKKGLRPPPEAEV